MDKQDILDMLEENRGKMISGSQMARVLGVSRNAIWKGINSLKQDGYHILSSSKAGYRLEDGEDVLSLAALKRHLKQKKLKESLLVFPSLSSTNTYLKEQGQKGQQDLLIAVAEEQTQGRGRMQRHFYSPKKEGVYFSILLHPPMQLTEINFLTFFCAIAVCDAIRETCKIEPRIKWPNDVMMDNKKLCGILTEASLEGESGQLQYVVVGAGINLLQKEEHFSPDIRNKATSVVLSGGQKCSRAELIAAVLEHFFKIYEAYLKGEKEQILSRYRDLLMMKNKEITVYDRGGSYSAIAIDIDDEAHLLVVDKEGKQHVLRSGEITVGGIYQE
jgi:BirA family biotin operon repressor/biotin-[acetyl-CoA-carboxylase] ligase